MAPNLKDNFQPQRLKEEWVISSQVGNWQMAIWHDVVSFELSQQITKREPINAVGEKSTRI